MNSLAIVRGKFLNQYEMQSYAPLVKSYDITAFGSLYPYHDAFGFPVVKLASPMDIPEIPFKMQILNRLFIDAHYLFGLESKLKGFDIAHTAETYYHYTQQCLNAKKKGYVKKVVATVLENIPHNNEGIWGRSAFKKRSRVELDHIIALTKKTRDALLLEGADPDKISIIGHGIDTKRFKPAIDHMKYLGRSKGIIQILFSGRMESYKGVFIILDALRILSQDKTLHIPFEMRFVGAGSQEEKMKNIIHAYALENRVQFVSVSYDRMQKEYEKADIVVAPSIGTKTWTEQYCTVLLEAQSMGLPIVTTRSGGIPENVGTCALFAEEHDPITLAKQLKRFIEDPALRVYFGRNARERAIKVHDVHIIAGKIHRVYQSLLP
jgi:glycosyltransferase involved in cell wall biosynthesis